METTFSNRRPEGDNGAHCAPLQRKFSQRPFSPRITCHELGSKPTRIPNEGEFLAATLLQPSIVKGLSLVSPAFPNGVTALVSFKEFQCHYFDPSCTKSVPLAQILAHGYNAQSNGEC